MSKTRTFRVTADRTVILPLSLLPGAGVTNQRLTAGDEFTLDAGAVDRFVRGLLRGEDVLEVTPSSPRAHGDVVHAELAAAPAPTSELDTAPVRHRKEK